MNILLIETKTSGHFISLYLKLILEELINKKYKIFFMTTKKIANDANYKFLNDKKINFVFIKDVKNPKYYNKVNLFFYQCRYFFNIKKNFNQIRSKAKPDLVYVNTLDHFDKALALFGSPFNDVNFSGLMCKFQFHLYNKKIGPKYWSNFIYEFLFGRLYKIPTIKKIFTIDNLFFTYFKEKNKDHKKIVYVNDAIDSNSFKVSKKDNFKDFKKKYEIDNNCFVILIYGHIRNNKGISNLINGLFFVKLKKRIKIIIAGKQEPMIRKYLEMYRHNHSNFDLILIDSFISHELENTIFSVSDAVWVGYVDHYGPSGVFSLAALKKIPVITSNIGIIHTLNTKFKVGVSVDINNSKDVGNKIKYLTLKNINYKNNFERLILHMKKNNFASKIVSNFKYIKSN
jgi:hypothetical protein